jgi:hypothetical protein
MATRQQPCKRCGGAVVLALAGNGGTFALEPWPDPDGRYEAALRGGRLVVLGRTDRTPDGTPLLRDPESKTYDPHSTTCTPADRASPRRPPQQTALDLEV